MKIIRDNPTDSTGLIFPAILWPWPDFAAGSDHWCLTAVLFWHPDEDRIHAKILLHGSSPDHHEFWHMTFTDEERDLVKWRDFIFIHDLCTPCFPSLAAAENYIPIFRSYLESKFHISDYSLPGTEEEKLDEAGGWKIFILDNRWNP